MRKTLLAFLSVILFLTVYSQTPEKFNYQGILRNTSGEMIKNTSVTVRISLLQGSTTGIVQYSENHTVTTNNYGQFSVNIGGGTVLTGVFATINWLQPMFLKTEVANPAGGTFVDMGTTQLISVPYALYAKNVENKDDADANPTNELQNLTLTGDTLKISNGNKVVFPYDSSKWAVNGNKLYYNTGNVGIGSLDPMSKLEVKSTSTTGALFQVINANSDTVFAVYPDGVKIFVDSDAKGKVGGFAISGRTPTKAGIPVEYFRVTTDSTRIYVNDSIGAKGKVGGFAISGRTPTKGGTIDYFTVNKDSARIYISDSVNSKGKVGGFAVSGRTPTKQGEINDYFNISGNSELEKVNSEARILWYPKKEAFLTGRVLVESPDSIGTNSMSTGFESKAIGNYSQALGYKAVARGNYSTAIGDSAVARGLSSFSFGDQTFADGDNSFAFGKESVASGKSSYALGSVLSLVKTQALKENSIAIGLGCIADGVGSISIGTSNTSGADYSFSAGRSNNASKVGATALGHLVSSSGDYSTALGYSTTASGNFSTALGYNTVASGLHSTAMGFGSQAIGEYSFATGVNSSANGDNSVVIGKNNIANGNSTISMGESATAEGISSVAFGKLAKATIANSIAIGEEATATGERCTAIGYRSKAIASYSATAIGDNAKALGQYSVSLGLFTQSVGISSLSMGWGSYSSGYSSTAFGNFTEATGDYSTAFGVESVASGDYSVAIGQSIQASGSYSVALALNNQMGTNVSQANTMAIMGGKVGIGTTTPSQILTVYNGTSTGAYTTTGWTHSSDLRLKTNIVPISDVFTNIMKMQGVYYEWKNDTGKRQIGFIAQDIEILFPEVVDTDENGYKSIAYGQLSAILVEAIKELKTENEELKKQLMEINNRLNAVEK
jgi:hypothetical protein